ncbi:hypothetical protein Kfla_6780 [Kribbella flavida DSM 17836]|uniref:Uncharacterized protein n=1 Tax=Kribbella flavida (strain DSM 17836 / JCM 10339 / NBRC 14399) TaxID=479435 RepID=D2Q170_KRIFD|nr:hypothetical protein [Kribbella flavida]ADB35771.1 hypothetical protein Kfla_6780 [Kribbella flavida DSM 17836]
MTRLVLSLTMFAALSAAVGFLLSGDDRTFDWRLGGGLFAFALLGELARGRIRRSRARSGQSSGI